MVQCQMVNQVVFNLQTHTFSNTRQTLNVSSFKLRTATKTRQWACRTLKMDLQSIDVSFVGETRIQDPNSVIRLTFVSVR